MDLIESIGRDLAAIREKRPLVHSITNYVVMNETANAVRCIGALPIMSHATEEVAEMVAMAGALVLNIGTLSPEWVNAMEIAGKRANELNIPVILDPVGAGATNLRTESSKRLLQNVKVSVVRGNSAEISTLVGIAAEIRGVESVSASASAQELAWLFASLHGCVAAVTGPIDHVSDGKRSAKISNGQVMLSKLVGTGCMANVIVAAFAAVDPDPFTAAVGGLATFGIAGEMAAALSGERPGTFHTELYNALYAVQPQDVREGARVDLIVEPAAA